MRAVITQLRQENERLKQELRTKQQPPVPTQQETTTVEPMQTNTSAPTPPPLKRKATTDLPPPSPSDCPSPQEMRAEYLALHETTQTRLATIQQSVAALHAELLECMRSLMPPDSISPTSVVPSNVPLPPEVDHDANI